MREGGTWVGAGEGDGGGDELKEQKYLSSQTLNVKSRHFDLVFLVTSLTFLTMAEPEVFLRCS